MKSNRPFVRIVILFACWFFLLNIVNGVSSYLLIDKTSYELPKNISIRPRHMFVPWLNFDGRNYLEIVHNGYIQKFKTDLKVFFPLYPLLIRIISLNFLLSPILIGLAISSLSFIGSLYVFEKLLNEEGVKSQQRKKIILLLLLFPTSYYFASYYTESLFLLLTLVAFYFLNQKKFLISSVFVALATATRIAGLALIPAIVWEAYREYRVTKKIPISIVLAPLGFIFYSTYIQIISGNALLIITQQKNWNKPVGILGPWFALKDGFSKAFFGSEFSRHNPLSHFIEQVEFVSIIFIIVVIITSIKKMRFSYWLYIFFSTALILFSGVLSSVHRYLVVLFPIYIYLVKVIPKKYFLFLCFIFVLLLLVLSCLFLRNYWVA